MIGWGDGPRKASFAWVEVVAYSIMLVILAVLIGMEV